MDIQNSRGQCLLEVLIVLLLIATIMKYTADLAQSDPLAHGLLSERTR